MRYFNVCQDPFEFIRSIKKRYKQGLTLVSPDLEDRALHPEDLLNRDIDLGDCENPLVLALIASRDPMVTMSMAATSRMGPLTVDHRLLSGVFEIVGDVSRHSEVKDCVHVMAKNRFSRESTYHLHNHVVQQIYLKRQQYRSLIKNNLKSLIDGHIAPEIFVDQFFLGMNQLNLKHQAYAKMVVDFLLSQKFRPKVKILLLEHFYKIPKQVRMQVVVDMCNAPKMGHNEAIRDELICLLRETPHLLGAHANHNDQQTPLKSYLEKPRLSDFEDQAFRTAESVLR